MKRVVVTGIGVYSPIGHGLKEFENSLREGKSAIKKWDKLEELNYACQVCARPEEVSLSKKEKYFDALTIKNLKHEGILLGSIVAIDAWKDSGLTILPKEKCDWNSGTIFGTGCSGNDLLAKKYYHLIDEKQIRKLGGRAIEQLMNSGISAYVGGLIGLGNQVSSNSSACATGTEAFIMGFERIAMGKAKRMIVGGSEGYNPYSWAGFDAMRVLCRDSNDNPAYSSRPMSDKPSGFVPGAGAGAFVLEDLESALERKAFIYAEVLGGNINSGGQRLNGTMTRPNAEAVKRCIEDSIKDSKINAEEIDLIGGHLTSTIGDVLEVSNWAKVLNRTGNSFPYINSLKSMIGHCLGGAGAIELVALIVQMQKKFIHPSLNSENLHPEIAKKIGRDKIPLEKIEKSLNIVAKSSFGFGDVNSCVILKNWKN